MCADFRVSTVCASSTHGKYGLKDVANIWIKKRLIQCCVIIAQAMQHKVLQLIKRNLLQNSFKLCIHLFICNKFTK